jgi:hypothetical protein
MQMLVSEHCFTQRVPTRNEKDFFVENLSIHRSESNLRTKTRRSQKTAYLMSQELKRVMKTTNGCAGWVRGTGVQDGDASIRRLIEAPDRSERLKPRPIREPAAKS